MDGETKDLRDRGGWLITVGVIELVLAVFCFFATAMATLGALFLRAVPMPNGAVPPTTRQVLPGIFTYAAATVLFAVIGVGTIRARRWARSLMHVLSWVWLVLGVLGMAMFLLVQGRMFDQIEHQTPGLMPGMASFMRGVLDVVLFGTFVILPAIFALFYGHRGVKATFERRDPTVPWTDRVPQPVLGAAVLVGGAAIMKLFMAATAYPVLVFGTILQGWAWHSVQVLEAIAWGALAVAIYRRRAFALWTCCGLIALSAASLGVTLARVEPEAIYAALGMTGQQLALARAMGLLGLRSFSYTFVVAAIGLGYLVSVRKHFRRA